MRSNYLLLIWLLMLGATSCSKHSDKAFADRSALLSYLNDDKNGLISNRETTSGVRYGLRYQPTSLLPGNMTDSLDQQFYFVLNLSYKGRELLGQLPQETYADLVNLFSFGMDKLVYFVCDNGQKENALMVFYQPTYNLTNANSLLVVGDKRWLRGKDKLRVEVDDFGLNTGKQEFEFTVSHLVEADEVEIIKNSH